ncbi:MAG: hypothetical protein C4551_06685 [Bacillota bacterium]|nr:MAG: hypothetical protein C4551_06685 [Bacillota bacterium]
MSPIYDVTAVWTEQYCSTLQIVAEDVEEAHRKARQIWKDDALEFTSNAEFETSCLLRFEVCAVDCLEYRGQLGGVSCPLCGRPPSP